MIRQSEDGAKYPPTRLAVPPWLVLLILAIAALLRGSRITEWSLWEDEETSLYFSQYPDRPFPRFFPLFFLLINQLFTLTGVSVGVGRGIAAALGVVSIGLTFACLRRRISAPVALVTALLLTINLGHLFWSQSIRYYTLLLVFQLLSIHWFLSGFEEGKYHQLLLSNLAFALALLTHFTAVLLAPVFVAYLALVIWRRESGGAYGLKGYLAFGLPFLAVFSAFSSKFLELQGMMSGWTIPSARDPVHLLASAVFYYGVPVVVLALFAPVLVRPFRTRVNLFFLLAAVVPALELVVIILLDMIDVVWYHAFFALVGFTTLASLSLVSLYRAGHRRTALVATGATTLYYAVFLLGYFTTMHGDRARWDKAVAYLRRAADVSDLSRGNPAIYATLPRVVAYYLGHEATASDQIPIRDARLQPPGGHGTGESWYVIEARLLTREYADWFARRGVLKARFEARTGPIDRSLLVYHCPAATSSQTTKRRASREILSWDVVDDKAEPHPGRQSTWHWTAPPGPPSPGGFSPDSRPH